MLKGGYSKPLRERIKAALSASAEPECGFCQGRRTVSADHMNMRPCPKCRAEPSERDELSPDEINQMAFEEGQPADDGDGYIFTQEEFDLFVARLLARAALERKP